MRLEVRWKDPAHDWPWYWFICTVSGGIWLKGADYPDGTAKHDGDVFFAGIEEIEWMRLA